MSDTPDTSSVVDVEESSTLPTLDLVAAAATVGGSPHNNAVRDPAYRPGDREYPRFLDGFTPRRQMNRRVRRTAAKLYRSAPEVARRRHAAFLEKQFRAALDAALALPADEAA